MDSICTQVWDTGQHSMLVHRSLCKHEGKAQFPDLVIFLYGRFPLIPGKTVSLACKSPGCQLQCIPELSSVMNA